MGALRYETLHGAAIRPHIDALAVLRVTVFREWPYLYDGTADYERNYLGRYAECARSIVVLVWDGPDCVAATTALPMADAPAEMQQPFREVSSNAAPAIERLLYFGESVVLADYRGQGIGVRFFELREAHARQLGLSHCTFCAVDRPSGHPAKLLSYVGNEAFWQRRGYTRHPELVCHFDWLDIGDAESHSHALTYWLRTL